MKNVFLFFIGFGLVVFFLWTTYLWRFFKSHHAGSYPTAETWTISAKQEDIIKGIKELKQEHPELDPSDRPVPNSRIVKYWYLEIFHYSDTDEDIEIYLRPGEDSLFTILGFTSIRQHMDTFTPEAKLNYTSSRDINKDYSYFENKKQIKKFEETILKPIMKELEKKDK